MNRARNTAGVSLSAGGAATCAALLALVLVLWPSAPARARMTFSGAEPLALAPRPEFLAVADLDADGRDDLVVVSPSSDKMQVLLGGSSPGAVFRNVQVYAQGRKLRRPAVADLDGDGVLDIAVADESARGIWVWTGRGDGSFAAVSFVSFGGRPTALARGDFDAANGADLAVADRRSGRITVLLNSGERPVAFRRGPVFNVGAGVDQIAVGDLDGDGAEDVLALRYGGRRGNELIVLYQQPPRAGIPAFADPVHLSAGVGATVLGAADLDGDARSDVVLLRYSPAAKVSTLDAMLSTSARTFAALPTRLIECPFGRRLGRCRARGLALGDFDGDGWADVAVAERVPRRRARGARDTVMVLRARGDGAFVDSGSSAGPRNPLAAASGDFNGDGLRDIVVTGRDDSVQVLINITQPGRTPLGGSCLLGDECVSGVCGNGVCCSSLCATDERCDLPGMEGTCSAP